MVWNWEVNCKNRGILLEIVGLGEVMFDLLVIGIFIGGIKEGFGWIIRDNLGLVC